MLCNNTAEYHCRNKWRTFGEGPTCVPLLDVCNGVTDCPFNDDEYAYPDNYNKPRNEHTEVNHHNDACSDSCNEIDTKNWHCPGDCIPTPDGPSCSCPHGLYFDNSVIISMIFGYLC